MLTGSNRVANHTQRIEHKGRKHSGAVKKPRRNRYAKSAKVSPYRLLRLMSCYAQDVPVQTAAQLLKLSERTVRDRYSEWRERLLPWAIAHPDRFNGFGHLLLDADGSLNRMMLEVMLWYAGTLSFKAHMQARYPRWNPQTDQIGRASCRERV